MQVVLEIHNAKTWVRNLDQALIAIVNQATSYPSEEAVRQQTWRPPESYTGERHWDGWHRLGQFYADGTAVIPSGLVDRVAEALAQKGIGTFRVDHRQRPVDGVPHREAIPLYDYQREASEAAWSAGQGVIDMPPRSGKTRTGLELHRMVSLPTLWFAPTNNIVKQTVRAAEDLFGKKYALAAKSGVTLQEARHHPLLICTAASARLLSPSVLEHFQMAVADEAHHAAARTWREILDAVPQVFHRYGLTGTNFRSGEDELALRAVFSRTLYRITPRELVARGRLVDVDVVFLPVFGPRHRVPAGRNFQNGTGKYNLHEHENRNALIAWVTATLVWNGYHPLVLVGTKQQGRILQSLLEPYLPGLAHGTSYRMCEFVSGDRDSDECQRVIQAHVEKLFPVLIGTIMIGEGTDLPSADALVYAKGMEAEVSHTQESYRVATAVPGKRRAVIVDFVDRHDRTLAQHSDGRLRTYYGQDTFHTSVLQDPAAFPEWLAGRQR